jgi:hypothetical protein
MSLNMDCILLHIPYVLENSVRRLVPFRCHRLTLNINLAFNSNAIVCSYTYHVLKFYGQSERYCDVDSPLADSIRFSVKNIRCLV